MRTVNNDTPKEIEVMEKGSVNKRLGSSLLLKLDLLHLFTFSSHLV